MIDYKKTGKECREAYFAYREAPIVGAPEASVTSFVAGWNAAIASMGQKPHEEPAKEPPKKWRILHPGESVRASDWENEDLNSETAPPDGPGWRPISMGKNGRSVLRDDKCIYARPVSDEPAKELEPAWEPKVGDWVLVTRPENWEECLFPSWDESMHRFDRQVGQIERERGRHFQIRGFVASKEWQYIFHRDWLSPATTSQPLKLPH